jgi:capsid assembly protease
MPTLKEPTVCYFSLAAKLYASEERMFCFNWPNWIQALAALLEALAAVGLVVLTKQPYAMLPARLNTLVQLLTTTDAAEIRLEQSRQMFGASAGRAGGRGFLSWGSVAVLPIYGIISHRESLLGWLFGGTSTQAVSASLRQLLSDPNVSTIVFDVDSPGGSVEGIQELSDEIFAARGKKCMVTVANAMMASAAYWIGSATHEIVVTPSGQVRSIGVYTAHEDISKALEKEGVKITLIRAGNTKLKTRHFNL